ncbi:hypothetical protein ANN_11409 [Periplaneta americana]|uniref:Uncharacterized protein n=1 Tax=Periplaneta americana TaxID=6978 RepID=A0ABQ8T4X2_PERAM|nr:hypothetical protein ANN_11409 [Periplaneta americana]
MSPGSSTESYLAFDCLGLRENSGKNLNQRDEMRSEDSPKYYAAFAFSVGETSEKPNQVIKSKGLMPRTRHRPSGFSPTAGENLRRNQSPKGDPTQARTQLRISSPASLPTELHR